MKRILKLFRFLHTTILTHVLPPTLLPTILLQLRATVFPQNSLGPPAPPPPSPERRLEIRAKAAHDILYFLPISIRNILFIISNPKKDTQQEAADQVERILDSVGDRRLNKYWIYGLVELVVTRLCPELVDRSPAELLMERGVSLSQTEVAYSTEDEGNSL
jgi:hypothetical protein